ncbi:MAG: hypothetical protein K2X41_03860 [Hyphomicrobium sp.]|nr:hypothetical protein [Hyphomicrobium sp.]
MLRLSAPAVSAIGAGVFAAAMIVASINAHAGMPRGAVLSADEQNGDETTGSTIARGNAEIMVPDYAINGKADVIELWPKRNEILLKGRADLTVGRHHYASDTLVCTLDFDRCTSPTASAADPQPAALLSEPPLTAATTPR